MSYNEDLLTNPPTTYNKALLADTVAHEIVHQWFGNLTTMTWWDDIWIIEGLCVHLAGKCLDSLEGYENIGYMKPFDDKRWA